MVCDVKTCVTACLSWVCNQQSTQNHCKMLAQLGNCLHSPGKFVWETIRQLLIIQPKSLFFQNGCRMTKQVLKVGASAMVACPFQCHIHCFSDLEGVQVTGFFETCVTLSYSITNVPCIGDF